MPSAAVGLAITLLVVAALLALLGWLVGVSERPQAWVVRIGTLAIGTTLLSLALLAPPVVGDLADLAVAGPHGDLGTSGAETVTRVALAALATAVLVVPGTWMDVTVGVLVTLAASAAGGDYRDRQALLACGDKPKQVQTPTKDPGKRDCPETTTPRQPSGTAVRVLVPKERAVAPVLPLPAGKTAVVVAVVEERDPEGRIATVARRHPVVPVAEVPAEQLIADVAVDVETQNAAAYQSFLADLTAAKTLRLLPR